MKMEKEQIKKIALIGLPVIVIIIAVIIFKFSTSKGYVPSEPYFTPEPETWISDDRNSEQSGDIIIDVQKATKSLSIFDNRKQEYYYYGKRIPFFSHGYYKGESFTGIYFDPIVYNLSEGKTQVEIEELIDENTLIQILPNMNPEDGVINGFILAKAENESFVFYLFVDQDWRNKIQFTNILWGDDLTDPSTLKVRPYDFSEEQDGIYVDKIDYDIGWIKKDTNGGVFLGEIDLNTLKIKSQKNLNATFIYVQ